MYEYISGTIAELNPALAIIEAGGIGYAVNISLHTYTELEGLREARLYTHFIIREDAQILYGFSSKQERELFRLLISVSGVGGGTARMVLSTYSPAELSNIIASENAVLLKNVKGLGLKTAQKIIVELRDKMLGFDSTSRDSGETFTPVATEAYTEAMSALAMLGFGKGASEKVVKSVMRENPSAPVEDIIRISLKKL